MLQAIEEIRKRDGRIVHFDQSKITEAIWLAVQAVGGEDRGRDETPCRPLAEADAPQEAGDRPHEAEGREERDDDPPDSAEPQRVVHQQGGRQRTLAARAGRLGR